MKTLSDLRFAAGLLGQHSLLAFTLSCWAGASILPNSLKAQENPIYIKGASVYRISDSILDSGGVLFHQNRILQVTETLEIPLPENTQVIDAQGMTLYPGLTLLNTTLGLVEIEAVRSTRDFREVGDWTPEVASWLAVNPDSELLAVARANGITHIAPVPQGGTLSGSSSLISLDGWTIEDRLVKTPVAFHVFWPGMQLQVYQNPNSARKPESVANQIKKQEEQIRSLEDYFKGARDYWIASRSSESPAPTNPSLASLTPLFEGKVPLILHANDQRAIETAVAWAKSHSFRLAIAGGRDAVKVSKLLGESHIPVIFDHLFTLPQDAERTYDDFFSAPAKLHQAGVPVMLSLGLDSFDASNARNLPFLCGQAVAHGWPFDEALKSLTLYPAQLLGVEDRMGQIAPGMAAHLVLANGSPLDIRTQILRVWIDGRETSIESRHTRLYKRYESRPKARPYPKQ